MTRSSSLAALILGAFLAAPLSAQDTAPADPAPVVDQEAPATEASGDLSLGEPANPDGIGSTYVAGNFGDWEQRCVRTEDGADPCQLYQLLKDAQGGAVAEISLFGLPEGGDAAAGATVVVPLGTLLTEGLLIGVDAAETKRYPFAWCSEIGCIARLGFTAAEVDGLRKGSAATMTLVPVLAPEEKVNLSISLKGFTAGFEAVNAANAAGAPVAGEAPAEGGN
jgi:invasion protein IalB